MHQHQSCSLMICFFPSLSAGNRFAHAFRLASNIKANIINKIAKLQPHATGLHPEVDEEAMMMHTNGYSRLRESCALCSQLAKNGTYRF